MSKEDILDDEIDEDDLIEEDFDFDELEMTSSITIFLVLDPIFKKLKGELIENSNFENIEIKGTAKIQAGNIGIPYFSLVEDSDVTIEYNTEKRSFRIISNIEYIEEYFNDFLESLLVTVEDTNIVWYELSTTLPIDHGLSNYLSTITKKTEINKISKILGVSDLQTYAIRLSQLDTPAQVEWFEIKLDPINSDAKRSSQVTIVYRTVKLDNFNKFIPKLTKIKKDMNDIISSGD